MSDGLRLGALVTSLLCLVAAAHVQPGTFDWFWWLVTAAILAVAATGLAAAELPETRT